MPAFKRRPSKFPAWLARLRAPDKRAQLSNAADSTEMRLLNGRPAEKGSFSMSRRQGWRFGATNCAICAAVVCLVNLSVTIAYGIRAQNDILFIGDCDEARQINTGLHLLINALSTILLGSSNYCMQCLSAPTRKEVDHAHAQRRSLDIGVLSVSNLFRISRKRAVMWAILGLTSVPLHLFYNSVIYLSIAVPNYRAIAVGESFVSGSPITNFTMSEPFVGKTSLDWDTETKTIYDSVRNGSYERLENLECINAYAQLLQTRRRNLVLVAADDSYPESTGILDRYGADSHIYWDLDFDGVNTIQVEETSKAFRWMCSSINSTDKNCPAAIEQFRTAPETWTVGAFCADAVCGDAGFVEKMQMTGPIQYCLSERAEEHCKVHWNLAIAALVTILNFIKAALIFYTALYTKEQPLMTMGDAVASFLEVEDPATVGMCLASKQDMWPASPRQWSGARIRWKDVTSKTRRVGTFLLLLTCLAAVGGLLYYGLRWLSYNQQSFTLPALARIGFGATDPRTIFQSTLYSIIGNALIANIPQVILSFIYLLLNSLFTAMLLGHEWASYTLTRKGLRTSGARRGSQRSTYFLSLPYRYAVPLMLVSALLHWLVSQSIFLVAIEYDAITNPALSPRPAKLQTACGYSPIAIVGVLFVGAVMLLSAVGFGFVPFGPGVNVVGSSSAAMSAACHAPFGEGGLDGGKQVWGQEVKWGVVVAAGEDGVDGVVGHCAFSSGEVEEVRVGGWYAGR